METVITDKWHSLMWSERYIRVTPETLKFSSGWTWGVNNLLSIEALNQTFHGQSSTPSTPQSKLLRGYLIRHSSTGGHSDWGFRGEQLSIKELLMWFVWLKAAPLTSLRINSSLIKLKATKANSCCQQVCMSLYHKQWNWANGKFA